MHVLIGAPQRAVETWSHQCTEQLWATQTWVAGAGRHLGPRRVVRCVAQIVDLRALPTCRYLYNNMLSGTLPKWTSMTAMTEL
jgi:hypothetical protein